MFPGRRMTAALDVKTLSRRKEPVYMTLHVYAKHKLKMRGVVAEFLVPARPPHASNQVYLL